MITKSLLILTVILWLPDCDSYLQKVKGFENGSYFREEVFEKHTWKTFFELNEPNQKIDVGNPDLHLLNAALFYATNKIRHKYNKPDLTFSSSLRDAAVIHTNEMVVKNFFSHTNSRNRKWNKPDIRVKQCGPLPKVVAENIDYIYIDEGDTYSSLSQRVVKHLYSSPPHRKNMLGKFSHLGTCTMLEYKDRDGFRYLKSTQDFATY